MSPGTPLVHIIHLMLGTLALLNNAEFLLFIGSRFAANLCLHVSSFFPDHLLSHDFCPTQYPTECMLNFSASTARLHASPSVEPTIPSQAGWDRANWQFLPFPQLYLFLLKTYVQNTSWDIMLCTASFATSGVLLTLQASILAKTRLLLPKQNLTDLPSSMCRFRIH